MRSTGEVQLLKVVGVERTRGTARVRLVCGGRALAALAGCLAREAALTAQLCCGPVRRVLDLLGQSEKRHGAAGAVGWWVAVTVQLCCGPAGSNRGV